MEIWYRLRLWSCSHADVSLFRSKSILCKLNYRAIIWGASFISRGLKIVFSQYFADSRIWLPLMGTNEMFSKPCDGCFGITIPLSLTQRTRNKETCLLPWISITFSVALTLNFAFLPWKLMVSHGQGFCSLCPAFVVFCQHFCSQHYKVFLTMWTVWWWCRFSLKMVITS